MVDLDVCYKNLNSISTPLSDVHLLYEVDAVPDPILTERLLRSAKTEG